MVNVAGIKQWLGQATNAEIRMPVTQAKDMGLEFDDRSVVGLFKEGIAVDIIIRKVGEEDFLPKRLEKYIDNDNIWDINEGFVNVKIVEIQNDRILDAIDVSNLLIRLLDNDIKVASRLEGENGFIKIRMTSITRDRFLNLKEVRDTLAGVLASGEYEFLVDEI